MKTQQVRSAVITASVTLLLVACGETPPVAGAATSRAKASPVQPSAPIPTTPLRAESDASAAPVQAPCPGPTPEYLPIRLRSPELRRQAAADTFKIAVMSSTVRHEYAVSVARVLEGKCLEARQPALSGWQT